MPEYMKNAFSSIFNLQREADRLTDVRENDPSLFCITSKTLPMDLSVSQFRGEKKEKKEEYQYQASSRRSSALSDLKGLENFLSKDK